MNQVIVVGRLVDDVKIEKTESGKSITTITLDVKRNYKNENGEYESDYIDCELWYAVAEQTKEYAEKGSLVGIRGRLQKNEKNEMKVIADKVSLLSTKKEV